MARKDLEELRFLLDKLTILNSVRDEDDVLDRLAGFERPVVLSFLNQNGLNLASRSEVFRNDLAGADVLLRDGVGIEVALRVFGDDPGINANGTDFIPKLLSRMGNRTIALFGTRPPWLAKAARSIEANSGVRVVAQLDGFQTEASYTRCTWDTDPDIILLGMGMPRQERVAAALVAISGRPRLIVNGGAFLDFSAGRFVRAPRWVRAARLEWMFRLAQEPRRLSRRYIEGGPRLAVTVARLWSAQMEASP